MAQIFGSKVKKSQKRFTAPQKFEISDKFLTRDGTEFVLHEFDSGNGSESVSGLDSRNSFKKKRGRPRKDEINLNSSGSEENCTSFDGSPESKARRERRERKERKREKLLRRALETSFEDGSTPKKRGRPRKFNVDGELQPEPEEIDRPNSIPGEFVLDFTAPSEQDCSSLPYSKASSPSGLSSRNSFTEAASIPRIHNHRKESERIHPHPHSHSRVNNFNGNQHIPPTFIQETSWTPIQRLTQLNQALALTNMYKDLLFWDRIVAEFINPNVQFRLEMGSLRAFEIPFLVISKFFWVSAQIGLHRLQLTYNGINELIGQQENNLQNNENGLVLFNSSDSFIYSQYYAEKLMVIRRAFQFIEFNASGKVTKWNIRIHKQDKYFKELPGKDEAELLEEFDNGFPKRLIEFLDVALVMNSVLPDSSSWLTWFYTYIQQNGLQNISVVELSRPPSPYRFVPEPEPTINKANLEFMERGQNFIFNILEGGSRKELEEIIAVDTGYQNNGNDGFLMDEDSDNEVDLVEMLQATTHPKTEEDRNTERTDNTDYNTRIDSVDIVTNTNLGSGAILPIESSGQDDFVQNIDDDDDFFDNYG